MKLLNLEKFSGILQSNSEKQWFEELTNCAQRLGYAEFLFGLKKTATAPLESAIIYSNYDETWRKNMMNRVTLSSIR